MLLSGNCNAAADSLPACINTMKISTESVVTEYEYKGQRCFVLTKINPPCENEVSDKITSTKFYNANCKLVCTWTKGGIAGFNKVTPDTIEKAKIKKIKIVLEDTIKKPSANLTALPDTIVKLALAKNVQEVKEYVYRDKILYTFRYPPYTKRLTKEDSLIIDYPYYDESGKVILTKKSAFLTMNSRAEYWQPISVYNSDVKEVKNGVWIREKNNYKKIPVSAEKAKDSIPPCINELKKMQNPTFLIEYNYKGQRWFAFSKDGSSPVSDVSDKITYTTFYNSNCKKVCFWTKNGTNGLNKVSPDTIQKEKIKKTGIVLYPLAISEQNASRGSVLPDSIRKLAQIKNNPWIEQISYRDRNIYIFQTPGNNLNSSEISFGGSFYNALGEIIVPNEHDHGKRSWWHFYNGTFRNTQFRPGFR